MAAWLFVSESELIPWGIVTNKLSRFTLPLLQTLELKQHAAVIIRGDAYLLILNLDIEYRRTWKIIADKLQFFYV